MKPITYPTRRHPGARRRARVLTATREHVKDRPSEIIVRVTAGDVGKDSDIGISRLFSEIEAAGFWVIRSSNPSLSHSGEIVVRPARSNPELRKRTHGPDRRQQ